MSFLELLRIECMKVKRSKIVPLIFIAPLLVVASGVASLSRYFTPEYTNAWPAMFIQSALVYAYRINSNQCFLVVADGGNCCTRFVPYFRSVRKWLCTKLEKSLDVV